MPAKDNRCVFLTLVLVLTACLLVTGRSSAQFLEPPAEQNYRVYFPELSFSIAPDWLGPDGGLISAVAFNRQDPAMIYAGSWGGGVYKSVNGGASWNRASRGLGNLTVVSLAVDPINPEIIYTGTYRDGVWKSADAGASWFQAGTGIQDDAIVYSIVIDPQNTQRLFAATRGYQRLDRPWAGVVYRTDDGGTTWTVSLANLGGADYQDWVYALEINPTRPNIIFGATHEHGPIRSTDYGKSWKVLTNGITNKSTRAIVVDPRPDYTDTVYTGVWTKAGVFKSDDGGGTWVLKEVGIAGANIYGMSINPFAPKTIFAATYNMGVMKTTNAANTWTAAGLKADGIATVRVNPTNGQIVYSGTAGNGLFVSADGGSNWRHSQDNLKASDATGLIVSADEPGVYYAGIRGSGVMSSTDSGKTWSDFSANLGDKFINALVKPPDRNILFALSENAGLYRCDLSNLSSCWAKISFNSTVTASGSLPLSYPYSTHENFLQAFGEWTADRADNPSALAAAGAPLTLRFAPSATDYAYLGTRDTGVFRSLDGGLSWAPTGWTGQHVWSLAVDSGNPEIVTGASDLPGVIHQSQNGGLTWNPIGIPGVIAYVLEASPTEMNVVWAGTDHGVYRYANGQWAQTGLSGQKVISLAFYPGKNNLLFAGTASGVWISKDGGSIWTAGPGELAGIPVQSIAFDPHAPDLVYYCTPAHGVLRAYIEWTFIQP
jgi:photosystem II stability/assembly factor-like uncharacterized protein